IWSSIRRPKISRNKSHLRHNHMVGRRHIPHDEVETPNACCFDELAEEVTPKCAGDDSRHRASLGHFVIRGDGIRQLPAQGPDERVVHYCSWRCSDSIYEDPGLYFVEFLGEGSAEGRTRTALTARISENGLSGKANEEVFPARRHDLR